MSGFTRRFRHGRACPGHPRRDVQSRSNIREPLAAIERLGILRSTRPVTAWMAGTSPAMTTAVWSPIKLSNHRYLEIRK